MKALSYLGLLLGLTAIALLVAWQDFGSVAGKLSAAGWGILLLPIVWLPHLFAGATCWLLVFLPEQAPSIRHAVTGTWIARSINTLFPVPSVGGDIVKARVTVLWGSRSADAAAAVVVDQFVQAVSLLLLALIGVVALLLLTADGDLAIAFLGGIALFAAGIGGFLVVQNAGAFGFIAKSVGKLVKSGPGGGLVTSAAEIDDIIRAVYRRPRRIVLSTAIMLSARIFFTIEIWLAAYLMGHPISILDALMLKGLIMALRGAAFMVPNGYGVQEGGYVVLGALVGLSPDVMLAVSLASRARELIVSVPGILVWQHTEGRALWKRFARKTGRRAG